MQEIKFDTEGLTSCPMKETATQEECWDCIYYKMNGAGTCVYKDIFAEEGMGLNASK